MTWNKISYGFRHVVAIKTDGTLWSCGYNSNGQLGLEDIINRSSPVQVGSLTIWNKVSCGMYYSTAIAQLPTYASSGYTNTYTAATSWIVTHNLGSYFIIVQCWDSSNILISPDSITQNSTNACTVDWGTSSTAGKVCVMSCA